MKTVSAELLSMIAARNAETQAWVEAAEGRWASTLCEDASYWAEQGIFTLEDFERDEMLSTISDLYKDVYGFRPRHINFETISTEELRTEYDFLLKELEGVVAREEAMKAEDEAEFRALVARTIELGAGDEETALRWLTQDEEFYNGQDVESWVYSQGILFTDYGRELVERLKALVTYKEWEVA